MIGGLKTTSRVALVAAAGLFASTMGASAADLGGNCCADLEERVAELEATTVRKGNRKVSVTLSGFVAHQVMYWDDGNRSDVYIGDGGNYGSRFRFVGKAKINANLTAGFLYEFGINNNAIQSMNQTNGGDDLGGAVGLRDTTVWLQHKQLGKIKIGHGSTATDNLILIDLGNRGGAATADVGLYNAGFLFQGGGGVYSSDSWGSVLGTGFDTTRRNHVLYETPTLAGFSIQAAVAEDNFWDVALRYAGEFGGVRVAFGIGYLNDTEFNGAAGALVCTSNCTKEVEEWKGSASILHVPTGLFVTGAVGSRDDSTAPARDMLFWYVSGGVSKNWTGIGATVLFGEYSEHNDFYGVDSKATHWGLGIVQHVDAAAMEIFLTYKNFSLDDNYRIGGVIPVDDFQTVIAGTRINF